MSTQILKLTNGETLIGEITHGTDPQFTHVVNPHIVRSGVSEDSRLIMSMTKWMESADEVIKIKNEHVISAAQASNFLIEYYDEVKTDELLDYDEQIEDNEDFTFTVPEGSTSVH